MCDTCTCHHPQREPTTPNHLADQNHLLLAITASSAKRFCVKVVWCARLTRVYQWCFSSVLNLTLLISFDIVHKWYSITGEESHSEHFHCWPWLQQPMQKVFAPQVFNRKKPNYGLKTQINLGRWYDLLQSSRSYCKRIVTAHVGRYLAIKIIKVTLFFLTRQTWRKLEECVLSRRCTQQQLPSKVLQSLRVQQ